MDDRLQEGIEARLAETMAEFEKAQRRYYHMRANRRLLGQKLLVLGVTERAVGKLAGVSGAAVHGWRKALDANQSAK